MDNKDPSHADVTRRAALCVAFCLSISLCLTSYSSTAQTHSGRDKQAAEPISIVSMDYCADQYVLALADKSQIVGLSADATSVYSFFRDRASGIPKLRGSTEEILARMPTLVVRQWRGSPKVDALLERAGIRVIALPFANSPDQALQSLIDFGGQIGRSEEAYAFAGKRKELRAKLLATPASKSQALYVTPSGYTAGTNTSVNAIIIAAGLQTMAHDYGLSGWRPLPLEIIAGAKPDLIITSFFELPGPTSRWSLSQSPLVNELLNGLPVIELPASMQSCNGLFDIDAAAHIHSEAAKLGLLTD